MQADYDLVDLVYLILAFIVAVIATARLTRLVVDDDWPPMAWLREKYVMAVPEKWAALVECPFCAAPWFALPNLLLAWASDLAWYWWLPNLWLSAAYLAAIVNVRDVPAD